MSPSFIEVLGVEEGVTTLHTYHSSPSLMEEEILNFRFFMN